MPHVYAALLSIDGGVCPDDGASLTFDPRSPSDIVVLLGGKMWAASATTGTGSLSAPVAR
jgi:hypothetical protein